jgi:predicted transcriptional regulator
MIYTKHARKRHKERYEVDHKDISAIHKKILRGENPMTEDEKLQFENPVQDFGWAMIPHAMTRDPDLSDGAYRTYTHLLEYAQQKKKAWPGIETVAEARGKEERTITRHFLELEKFGYIKRQRRYGKTTMTWIRDAFDLSRLKEIVERTIEQTRDKIFSEQDKNVLIDEEPDENVLIDQTKMSSQKGQKCPAEEEQRKRTIIKNKDGFSFLEEHKLAWSRVKDYLKDDMAKATYDAWVYQTEYYGSSNGEGETTTLFVAVENTYNRDWLTERITKTAERQLAGILNNTMAKVEFITNGETE